MRDSGTLKKTRRTTATEAFTIPQFAAGTPQMMRAIFMLMAAVLLGLGGGYAWSQWSKPSAADEANAPAFPAAKPGQTAGDVEQSEYYADCAAAAKAGKQPLWAGQPGYRAELDPDGDGLACPPTS